MLAAALVRVVVSDPHDLPLVGDQASYIQTALSINGGNLSYDADDHRAWLDLGWTDQPYGLWVQRNSDGWAAAKPIGFSLYLAPWLQLFGLRGVHLAGAFLCLAYAACWYLCGRLRWNAETSIVMAVAATVAGFTWFYAFPAHADLFLGVVTGVIAYGCLRARLRSDAVGFVVACALAGTLFTEKISAMFAVLPLLVVAASRLAWRPRVVGALSIVGAAVASALPYLYYSDGASWSAYAGDRYYVSRTTPWSGGSFSDLVPTSAGEYFSPGYVLERLTPPDRQLPGAAVTYLIGRHTGVLTFAPLIAALLAVSCYVLLRRRRRDGDGGVGSPRGERPRAPALAVAAIVSLVLYAGFYLVLLTRNYYGGGQSIGNRYFLQMSSVAVVVPVAAGVSARAVRRCAYFAVVWAVVVLGPQMLHADRAFVDLSSTSPVQRILPFESTQKYRAFFRS